MRAFVLLISILFVTVGANAQTPNVPGTPEAPPDIQIVKHSWTKERLNWEGDALNSAVAGGDTRRRVRREETRRTALEEREVLEEKIAKSQPSAPPRYVFSYKMTVRNGTQKTIKEIDWDYIFTDAATGEELGRREFTSVEKIGAGKSKGLSVLVSSPPTQRISVYTLGKKERDGLNEQVIVVRILYDDGTVWQAR